MKITRRVLFGSVAAAAIAQTPPAPPVPEPAADVNKRNTDAIAKVPLPQSTEPAFTFKA